jgi:hypothetical protein
MGVLAKRRITVNFGAAGFVVTQFSSELVPNFGLYFPETWSLPILARKPLS